MKQRASSRSYVSFRLGPISKAPHGSSLPSVHVVQGRAAKMRMERFHLEENQRYPGAFLSLDKEDSGREGDDRNVALLSSVSERREGVFFYRAQWLSNS